MRRIALFTGAGVSKAFAFPLTRELLPRIRDGLVRDRLFGPSARDRRDHAALREALLAAVPGFDTVADEDLPLYTDVLSVLDHSALTATSLTPDLSHERIPRVRTLLKRALFEALGWDDYWQRAEPETLQRLARFLTAGFRRGDVLVALISTNYDPTLEFRAFEALARRRRRPADQVDFGVEARDLSTGALMPRPHEPRLCVFKLHGSLNYLRCPACDRLVIGMDGGAIRLGFRPEAERDAANTCPSDGAPLEPVMVAPSLVRDVRDTNLLEIWRHATEFLRLADDWIIAGYSLPSEDLEIRAMFLRALHARRRPPRVAVVQSGLDHGTAARYAALFPEARYGSGGTESLAAHAGELPAWARRLPPIARQLDRARENANGVQPPRPAIPAPRHSTRRRASARPPTAGGRNGRPSR